MVAAATFPSVVVADTVATVVLAVTADVVMPPAVALEHQLLYQFSREVRSLDEVHDESQTPFGEECREVRSDD